jgi:hypothetical protein
MQGPVTIHANVTSCLVPTQKRVSVATPQALAAVFEQKAIRSLNVRNARYPTFEFGIPRTEGCAEATIEPSLGCRVVKNSKQQPVLGLLYLKTLLRFARLPA